MPNIRPESIEAPDYYWRYINLAGGDDIQGVLAAQYVELPELFASISEEASRHRYAPDKWSIRQVLGHLNDCERLFIFRAFWFARGFDSTLPNFDQEVAAAHDASADRSWSSLVEEFRELRASTLSFVSHLPPEAWSRRGFTTGDNLFTVRALVYIAAGHVAHHASVLRDRYLRNGARL